MKLFKYSTFVVFILLSCWVYSQGKQYILALSKTEGKLLVLDYTTLNTITDIPVGKDPHEIVVDEPRGLAYVSKPVMNDNGHEISVVNLQTLQVEKTIDTRPFYIPHGIMYQKDKLWFTAQGSKSVVLYDLPTHQVEQVFGTGQDFTHLIFVTPDGDRFYTTNVESGTVSIYEKKWLPPYMPPTGVLPPNAQPRLEWRQTLVDVGYGAEGFDVSSDGTELWTARPDGYVIIVDLKTKKVKDTINTHVEGLHRLKMVPDQESVCIVSVKTGDLLFYNTRSLELEKKMNIGKGAGIFMDKKSNRMFISCTPDNYVVVIDLATRKVIRKIDIGRPDAITSAFLE